MTKSYVPRMLSLAKTLAVYITRHQSTIFKYVTDPAQQAAITSCATCLQNLATLIPYTKEAP